MPQAILLEDVRQLLDQGAHLLDVLSRKEYDNSHLPGAVHIALHELDETSTAALDRDVPVIAYCYDYA